MNNVLIGNAWVFTGLLDIDFDICPYNLGRDLRADTPEALSQYCMVNIDPEFPRKVHKGDFIVAGENMGYGHDHDHACLSMLGAGVAAVLCESAAPYFLRNSIEHGLPVIELPGVLEKVRQGDTLQIDLTVGTVSNQRSGETLRFMPPPDFILEMLRSGGVYALLTRLAQEGHLPKRRMQA